LLGGVAGPPAPSVMRLVVVDGPDLGREVKVEQGTYHVGKDPRCDLVLTDGAISRRHLSIEMSADGVVLRDLGSKNGSFFHGARFREMTLRPGAAVTIGRSELRLLGLAAPTVDEQRFGRLLGASPAMREVFATLKRVARSDAAVLIEGETGTGKELCAEAI